VELLICKIRLVQILKALLDLKSRLAVSKDGSAVRYDTIVKFFDSSEPSNLLVPAMVPCEEQNLLERIYVFDRLLGFLQELILNIP